MLYPEASVGAIDLLSRLLTFNPDERITAEQALQSPYFAEYRKFGLAQTREPLDEREFASERNRFYYVKWRNIIPKRNKTSEKESVLLCLSLLF